MCRLPTIRLNILISTCIQKLLKILFLSPILIHYSSAQFVMLRVDVGSRHTRYGGQSSETLPTASTQLQQQRSSRHAAQCSCCRQLHKVSTQRSDTESSRCRRRCSYKWTGHSTACWLDNDFTEVYQCQICAVLCGTPLRQPHLSHSSSSHFLWLVLPSLSVPP